jgi:ParB family chromosome partitioning protein
MQVVQKPIGWFKPGPKIRLTTRNGRLRPLGESIGQGQINPVIALADGTMIIGEQRLAAALLDGRVDSLWVRIVDGPLSDSQIKTMQLVEKMHRMDLTSYEKWIACCDLLAMHPDWELKKLAEHLNFDPSMITRIMSPSNCIGEVQQALKDEEIGIKACYAISKQPKEKQGALLELHRSGVGGDGLEKAGRALRTGKPQASTTIRHVRCVLSSGINVIVSGKEITIDCMIDAFAEAIKEARKARDQGQDAKTLAAILKNKARAKTQIVA